MSFFLPFELQFTEVQSVEHCLADPESFYYESIEAAILAHATLAKHCGERILGELFKFARMIPDIPDHQACQYAGKFVPLYMWFGDDPKLQESGRWGRPALKWELTLEYPLVRKLRSAIEDGAKAEGD